MATTDTELQQLVINVGTEAQIEAGIASGTITSDMLSIATDGADITYDWVGTLAEYNEQNVATNHPDWLCFITDDVNNSGEDVYNNVYSKTEADEIFVAKTDNLPQYLPNLLEFKWSDHLLNSVSWLRADTFSWQSGKLYEAAYQHLVNDIEGKTLQTETISGVTISYYLADDMHKICPADQESNIVAIYEATGIAWYYILDTTNERFKLPRTTFAFTGVRDQVGNYITPGLPNITGQLTPLNRGIYRANSDATATGALTFSSEKSGNTVSTASGSYNASDIKFDASRSSSIYGNSNSVQPPATEMYLYFYVGEFTQDAILNTAGITAEELNAKADADAVVAKGHEVIAFQAPTSENNYTWYRKYADGWVEQGGISNAGSGTSGTITLPITMQDNNYTAIAGNGNNAANNYFTISRPEATTTTIKWYKSSTGLYGYWQVSGMAAA